jgi:hypothetical protein
MGSSMASLNALTPECLFCSNSDIRLRLLGGQEFAGKSHRIQRRKRFYLERAARPSKSTRKPNSKSSSSFVGWMKPSTRLVAG